MNFYMNYILFHVNLFFSQIKKIYIIQNYYKIFKKNKTSIRNYVNYNTKTIKEDNNSLFLMKNKTYFF